MPATPREFVGRRETGEFAVEPWRAHLWADATSNPDDRFRDGAEAAAVPPTLAVHLAREATGMETVETGLRETAGFDVFLGGQGITVQQPLRVETPYLVEAVVRPVEEKTGSSGDFSVVTVAYEAATADGRTAFEAHTDIIVQTEGGGS